MRTGKGETFRSPSDTEVLVGHVCESDVDDHNSVRIHQGNKWADRKAVNSYLLIIRFMPMRGRAGPFQLRDADVAD